MPDWLYHDRCGVFSDGEHRPLAGGQCNGCALWPVNMTPDYDVAGPVIEINSSNGILYAPAVGPLAGVVVRGNAVDEHGRPGHVSTDLAHLIGKRIDIDENNAFWRQYRPDFDLAKAGAADILDLRFLNADGSEYEPAEDDWRQSTAADIYGPF